MSAAASGDLPAALEAALAAHPRARAYFEQMPASHRREHVDHVAEAKKEATRARRAAKAIPMILAWGEERDAKARR